MFKFLCIIYFKNLQFLPHTSRWLDQEPKRFYFAFYEETIYCWVIAFEKYQINFETMCRFSLQLILREYNHSIASTYIKLTRPHLLKSNKWSWVLSISLFWVTLNLGRVILLLVYILHSFVRLQIGWKG